MRKVVDLKAKIGCVDQNRNLTSKWPVGREASFKTASRVSCPEIPLKDFRDSAY